MLFLNAKLTAKLQLNVEGIENEDCVMQSEIDKNHMTHQKYCIAK